MFRHRTVAIILIIATISTSSCRASKSEDERSVLLARETILRDNLYHLRKSIDLYTADHNALPQSLDDLVKAGYVREIPIDPLTDRKDWKVTIGDDPNDKGKKGIADVHSASTAKSSEGILYSDW
jgi:general secretion pathway protein G